MGMGRSGGRECGGPPRLGPQSPAWMCHPDWCGGPQQSGDLASVSSQTTGISAPHAPHHVWKGPQPVWR